jgi:hypothetical protein
MPGSDGEAMTAGCWRGSVLLRFMYAIAAPLKGRVG